VDTSKTLTEGLRVNVTTAQREALERIAARDDRSVASVIRRAIREMLERERQEEVAA
jgi:predicted transcriptional regulator